jgi:uncharacterized membrane protein YuzA (DUF378 family)
MKTCLVCRVVAVVAALGAINWGMIALFNFNIVAWIFGSMTFSARLIYGLIGGMGFLLMFSTSFGCAFCRK